MWRMILDSSSGFGGERENATTLVAGILEVMQIGKILIYGHGLDLNVV